MAFSKFTPKAGWLSILGINAGTHVQGSRHPSATPATWSSTSLTHGQAQHKTSSTKLLINGESGCEHGRKRKNITMNTC